MVKTQISKNYCLLGVTPYNLVDIYLRFRNRTCSLHLEKDSSMHTRLHGLLSCKSVISIIATAKNQTSHIRYLYRPGIEPRIIVPPACTDWTAVIRLDDMELILRCYKLRFVSLFLWHVKFERRWVAMSVLILTTDVSPIQKGHRILCVR